MKPGLTGPRPPVGGPCGSPVPLLSALLRGSHSLQGRKAPLPRPPGALGREAPLCCWTGVLTFPHWLPSPFCALLAEGTLNILSHHSFLASTLIDITP